MRLLFVYSVKFKKDVDGNLYTEGSVNEQMWERYTKLSDDLTIISRLDEDEYDREYARSCFNDFDNSNKKMIPVPDLFSNINNFLNFKLVKAFNKIIEENVINSDYIIARVPCNAGYSAIKYAKKHNKPYLVEAGRLYMGCFMAS